MCRSPGFYCLFGSENIKQKPYFLGCLFGSGGILASRARKSYLAEEVCLKKLIIKIKAEVLWLIF